MPSAYASLKDYYEVYKVKKPIVTRQQTFVIPRINPSVTKPRSKDSFFYIINGVVYQLKNFT